MESIQYRSPERWLVVAVLAAPLIYCLSFGPACWYGTQDRVTRNWVTRIYAPILDIRSRSPEFVQQAISSYANLGVGKDQVELGDGCYIDYWYEFEE